MKRKVKTYIALVYTGRCDIFFRYFMIHTLYVGMKSELSMISFATTPEAGR